MTRAIRHAAIVLLAAALGSCSMFDYSGIVTRRFALVYGVTRYTMAAGNGTGPNLQFPDSDASAIYAVLKSNGYAITGRWVDGTGAVWKNNALTGGFIGSPNYDINGTFTDGGSGIADAPTRSNIIADVQALANTMGPNDIVVVYFSGHGTQDTSVTPSREYFDPYQSVAYFANSQSPGYYDNPSTSVRDDDLAAAFASISTPRKVLVLDTCNSGGFIGNQLEVDWTPPAYLGGASLVGPGTLIQAISNYASMQSSPTGLSPYGAQVLSAAGRDESCYESGSPYFHGVMTYYLLQGLQGSQADLNHDGHVTVLEAFSYAKAGIEQNWNPNEPTGYTFEPHVSGGPVDFVLF